MTRKYQPQPREATRSSPGTMMLSSPASSSPSQSWPPVPLSPKLQPPSTLKPIPFSTNPHARRGLISYCSSPNAVTPPPAVVKRRKRYRKPYPGESEGIVQEMRFVAMKLRTDIPEREGNEVSQSSEEEDETWQPSMEGFLRYLVDSRLVFSTLDRIVEQSDHVAYAYFRKTGLERTEGISKDLEWLAEQGFAIPEPGSPGINYAKYLVGVAEESAPSFLCHFYNIYFAHIAGGQVIARQVSEKLLEGRELELNKWEGNVQELLRSVRENLNKVGEHWPREEKNRCLREASKSFRMTEQIVRLIIL